MVFLSGWRWQWRCCGRPFIASALILGAPLDVRAQSAVSDPFHELETKYLFGFTVGSDIGEEGEKELELETTAAFEKSGGHYGVVQPELAFEGVPTQFFSYEVSVHGQWNSISGVDGFDDRHGANFSGLSTDLRYLLLERGQGSPIGLTVSAEPEWDRVDGATGRLTRDFSAETRLEADTELIPNHFFAAANLIYGPDIAREYGALDWNHSALMGVTTAIAYRITPKITLGSELEYYRAYEGLAFNTPAGDALYLGPTLHIQFNSKFFLALAWSAQVAGHATGNNGYLDLTNFEREHVNMKLGWEF